MIRQKLFILALCLLHKSFVNSHEILMLIDNVNNGVDKEVLNPASASMIKANLDVLKQRLDDFLAEHTGNFVEQQTKVDLLEMQKAELITQLDFLKARLSDAENFNDNVDKINAEVRQEAAENINEMFCSLLKNKDELESRWSRDSVVQRAESMKALCSQLLEQKKAIECEKSLLESKVNELKDEVVRLSHWNKKIYQEGACAIEENELNISKLEKLAGMAEGFSRKVNSLILENDLLSQILNSTLNEKNCLENCIKTTQQAPPADIQPSISYKNQEVINVLNQKALVEVDLTNLKAKYDSEVKDLSQKIEAQRATVFGLAQELQKKRDELVDLVNARESKTAGEVEETKKQILNLEQQVYSLSADVDRKNLIISKKEEKLELIKKEQDKNSEKIKELLSYLDSISMKANEFGQRHEELAGAYAFRIEDARRSFKKELDQASNLLKKKDQKIRSFRWRSDKKLSALAEREKLFAQENARLQSALKSANEHVDLLRDSLSQLHEEHFDVSLESKKAACNIKSAQEALEKMEREKDLLQQKILRKKEKIRALKSKVAQNSESTNNLVASLCKRSAVASELVAQKNFLSHQVSVLNKALDVVDSRNEELASFVPDAKEAEFINYFKSLKAPDLAQDKLASLPAHIKDYIQGGRVDGLIKKLVPSKNSLTALLDNPKFLQNANVADIAELKAMRVQEKASLLLAKKIAHVRASFV